MLRICLNFHFKITMSYSAFENDLKNIPFKGLIS